MLGNSPPLGVPVGIIAVAGLAGLNYLCLHVVWHLRSFRKWQCDSIVQVYVIETISNVTKVP